MGLCLQQGENTLASCWGFKRNLDGTFAAKNNSYQINLALVSEGGQLSDHVDIGTYATPAFNGSWLCGQVMSCPETDWQTVGCLRFMPKEEYATLADPRFAKGELKVVTYLEGRTAHTDDESGPTIQQKLDDAKEKLTTSLGEMNPFREFSVNLTMGATSGLLVSASVFVMALLSVSF